MTLYVYNLNGRKKMKKDKGRYKAFLRNTSNVSATGRHAINLPEEIWKTMGWSINENLQIDIIKYGMVRSINIIKGDTDDESLG